MYFLNTSQKNIIHYTNIIKLMLSGEFREKLENSPNGEILVDFNELKITDVGRDGNCLFSSFMVGLKDLPSGKNFIQSLPKNNDPTKSLRTLCCYVLYNLIFDLDDSFHDENLDYFSAKKDDYSLLFHKANTEKNKFEKGVTLPDKLSDSEHVQKLMDSYLLSYGITEDSKTKTISNRLKGSLEHFFRKMICNGIYSDLLIMGLAISYLFNVVIKYATVNNSGSAVWEKNIIKWKKETKDIIYILHSRKINHFDAIVKRDPDDIDEPEGYMKNTFKVSETVKSILQQQKNFTGPLLNTQIKPSFHSSDSMLQLSSTSPFYTKVNMETNDTAGLPDSVLLTCSHVCMSRKAEDGAVGEFIKIDFGIEDNLDKKITTFIITANNFNKSLFNVSEKEKKSNYICLFKLDGEYNNSNWYINSYIKIYSYYKEKKCTRVSLSSFKEKKSREPISFSYMISPTYPTPAYIFMEVSDSDINGDDMDKKKTTFDNILKGLLRTY